MKRFFVTFALLLTPTYARAESGDVRILQTGDIFIEDVPQEKDGWFGLYGNDLNYTLVPVALTIEPYFRELIDSESIKDDRSKWPGRTLGVKPEKSDVKLSPASEPLLVLRAKGLSSGPLMTAFPGNGSIEQKEPGSFAPVERISMNLGKRSYDLIGQFFVSPCRVTLHLSSALPAPPADQTLMEQLKDPGNMTSDAYRALPFAPIYCSRDFTDYPKLIWAGDLDRDDKLDLILEGDHDSTYTWYLFLSTRAEPGHQVKLAAKFTRPAGC